jgi:VWFA-related protein
MCKSMGVPGVWCFAFILLLAVFGPFIGLPRAFAQTNSATAPSAESQPEFQIKVRSNLVVVRVVVRDAQGKPVDGLRKEDFKVLDRGKEQSISQFEVETSTPPPATLEQKSTPEQTVPTPPPATPGNFVAFYFDDLNTSNADMNFARDAADRYLAGNLQPNDRAAIFTSGQMLSDFTADPQQIHAALAKLQSSALSTRARNCPDLSDYQALEIMQQNPESSEAWQMALQEAVERCKLAPVSQDSDIRGLPGDSPAAEKAEAQSPGSRADSQLVDMIRMIAQKIVSQGETQARSNLDQLEQVVKYISHMPGRRTIILVSSGFLSQSEQYELNRVIDRAVRSQVVISSLDPKGLAPPREGDASRSYIAGRAGSAERLDSRRDLAAADVLAQVAQDTGGEFFHNNNDLKSGFGALAGSPVSYLLAFAPSDKKENGKFHPLKVNLVEKHKGFTVQARRGYFAPKNAADADGETKGQTGSGSEAETEEHIREAFLAKTESQHLAGLGKKAQDGQGPTVHVMVLTDTRQPLDRQSVVRLYSETNKATLWQTTTDHSAADFGGLSFGKYDIDVNVAGYMSAHEEVEIANMIDTVHVEVVLQRDPAVAELDASDALISPRAAKEIKRAVQELKSGNLEKAEKDLAATYKLAPSSAAVNFLFGYLFLQKRDLEQAQTYLTQATTLNPHYGHALTLLGRVQLLRRQYDAARPTLEQAVAADPGNWMAHNLLADVFLQRQDYEKAREQAQLAVDTGQGVGTAAQLPLGEALAGLGKFPEAIQAMKTFLQAEPQSPAAPQARQFIATVEKRNSRVNEATATSAAPISSAARADTLLAASKPSLPETSWQPPGIDRAKPVVAGGVVCPYEKVISESGKRVEQLVNDVGKFAAVEDLLHERLDEMGNPTLKETRKFDYAASITETHEGGGFKVDEFRTERYGKDDLPDHFADNGFAALALIFHPSQRNDFHMNCEGLSDWHGQATWLIHFQQRADRPSHVQAYMIGGAAYLVNMKGRAWITADKFQIVRIESEMVSPLPEIQLLSQRQITEYGPVFFAKKHVELWLPKSAEVYLHFAGHRYYRRHNFGKYMLFSVDTDQNDREAKHDPHGPASTSPRKIKRYRA